MLSNQRPTRKRGIRQWGREDKRNTHEAGWISRRVVLRGSFSPSCTSVPAGSQEPLFPSRNSFPRDRSDHKVSSHNRPLPLARRVGSRRLTICLLPFFSKHTLDGCTNQPVPTKDELAIFQRVGKHIRHPLVSENVAPTQPTTRPRSPFFCWASKPRKGDRPNVAAVIQKHGKRPIPSQEKRLFESDCSPLAFSFCFFSSLTTTPLHPCSPSSSALPAPKHSRRRSIHLVLQRRKSSRRFHVGSRRKAKRRRRRFPPTSPLNSFSR